MDTQYRDLYSSMWVSLRVGSLSKEIFNCLALVKGKKRRNSDKKHIELLVADDSMDEFTILILRSQSIFYDANITIGCLVALRNCKSFGNHYAAWLADSGVITTVANSFGEITSDCQPDTVVYSERCQVLLRWMKQRQLFKIHSIMIKDAPSCESSVATWFCHLNEFDNLTKFVKDPLLLVAEGADHYRQWKWLMNTADDVFVVVFVSNQMVQRLLCNIPAALVVHSHYCNTHLYPFDKAVTTVLLSFQALISSRQLVCIEVTQHMNEFYLLQFTPVHCQG